MADMLAWPVISFTYYKQHTLLSYIRFYFIWIHIQSHYDIIKLYEKYINYKDYKRPTQAKPHFYSNHGA